MILQTRMGAIEERFGRIMKADGTSNGHLVPTAAKFLWIVIGQSFLDLEWFTDVNNNTSRMIRVGRATAPSVAGGKYRRLCTWYIDMVKTYASLPERPNERHSPYRTQWSS